MHRLAVVEAQLLPSAMNQPNIRNNFLSQVEHDNYGHKQQKRVELDIAERERRWADELRPRLDTITPPSQQPFFDPSPDRWIARSETLIALTGPHPFNAEPPLHLHTNHIITPNTLHFVRNRGSVPRLEWDTHQLSVAGVKDEYHREYSMSSLAALPRHSVLVTIACEANRRKEMNMEEQSISFGWGAAAVATATWTGVRLVDLFKDINIDASYHAGQKLHLCFENAEKLHTGPYGTSVDFTYCMDPAHEVLLAYEQNGERLAPDLGAPLRLIIPGFVDCRQVKWLTKIWVSDKETDNWYHHHSNKLLPSSVKTEAAAMSWWSRTPPVYEMSLQSVITQPIHEEWIDATKPSAPHREPDANVQQPPPPSPNSKKPKPSSPPDHYTLRGYAYTGGGRSIVRVEVSLDRGHSWQAAQLHAVSDALKLSRRWCWSQWSLSVPLYSFYHAPSIRCRATDSGFTHQPEHCVWNYCGLLSNGHYEVRIDYQNPQSVRFIHPVQPDPLIDNGWKQPRAAPLLQSAPRGLAFQTTSSISTRIIPLSEVAKHSSEHECWTIIDGRVYDFSVYLADHPGGVHSITVHAGRNASAVFHSVHSNADMLKRIETFMIGTAGPPAIPKLLQPYTQREQYAIQVFSWVKARLSKRKEVSSDVRIFTFEFPDQKGKKAGLPVGQHLLIGATIGKRRFVVRPYGPIRPIGRDAEDDGTTDVLMKIYRPTDGKPGGLLSCYMDSLSVGDEVMIKGPSGPVLYEGHGNLSYQGRSFHVDTINFVCGGTGIAPAYQMIYAILRGHGNGDKKDNTELSLLYSNTRPGEILLRAELNELAEQFRDQFHLFYSVDKLEEGMEKSSWPFHIGHIDEAVIRQHLLPPKETCVVFVCGPPPMLQLAVYPNLEKCGFNLKTQVLDF